jgi:Flp pilus assembly pilin Flp
MVGRDHPPGTVDKEHHMGLGVKNFLRNEDGAVTVDWVVLTAAIVGLGMVVIVPIASSSNSVATSTSGRISGVEVGFTPSETD